MKRMAGLVAATVFLGIDKENLGLRFVTDYTVGSFYFSWVM